MSRRQFPPSSLSSDHPALLVDQTRRASSTNWRFAASPPHRRTARAFGPTHTLTDRELMRRVQADDPDAFSTLYDRLAPRALALARVILNADPSRSQDAVQEGLLSVWRSRHGYRPEAGDVHAWVFGIVRHRAIDAYRRGSRHDNRRSGDEGAADRIRAPDDVHAAAAANCDRAELRRILDDLPATQREVIALAYYGGLSHTEIASQLTVPVGTVKGRMRLGLNRMRERIQR